MKKKLLFSLLSFVSCLWNTLPVLAQCNVTQASKTTTVDVGLTMGGQTFTPTCNGRLMAISFGALAPGNGVAATVNIKSSACAGTVLKTKDITMVGAVGAGLNNTVTFTTSLNVTANTTYFLEILSTRADAILAHTADVYTGGIFYDNFGGSCSSVSSADLTFSLLIDVPLPIELTVFDVQNTEGGKNHLTWTTASETNNKTFDIERSTDGTTFHSIGQVKGNNKPSSYQFVDHQPFATSYYRLRQIDFDGTETLSKVVSVELKGKSKGLKVYPTLVSNGILTVDTDGTSRENREGGQLRDFSVMNLLGQQVLVGKTTQQLDVSSLAKGTYMLKVGSEVAKFVKQ
jgi:Secretion system C-terminal sorting domain